MIQLAILLLTLPAGAGYTCAANGLDSDSDCDAGGSSGDVCTTSAVGSYEIWICDLAVPGDSDAASINFKKDVTGDRHMEAWGTAGNGSEFCCAQDPDVTVELRVFGTSNDDVLEIHDGSDVFRMSHPSSVVSPIKVHGREGADTIETSTDKSVDLPWTLYGEDGDDDIYCQGVGSSFTGCTAYGGDGIDELYGSDGNDTLSGGADRDTISGGDGLDTILGGSGDDTLYGGDGVDTINGDGGADDICGGDGGDVLSGGPGVDDICGEAGQDYLYGNLGNDKLYGGSGSDSDECDGGSISDYVSCYCDGSETLCDTSLSVCPISCP